MGKEEKMSVNRDMNKDEKLKALDAALTQIEKAYGKGSVMKLGESEREELLRYTDRNPQVRRR